MEMTNKWTQGMNKYFLAAILCLFAMISICPQVLGKERFPPPDFVETDYQMPSVDYVLQDQARSNIFEYIDSAVLILTLAAGVFFIFYKRSRVLIYSLMIFSLIYFGFIRLGCVCSIGAIQNACLSVFDSQYVISFTIIVFFLAPLVVCLFFGRIFCGSVCPLGAIQDFVLIRPVKIPMWLESTLRMFAYIYLGLAVVLAATGSAFLICRYDPFISFFRFSGPFNIIILGICLLLIGAFIGRPYCRFLCPYSVILRQLSRISKRKVSITPDECIKCGLCVDACPFNAIEKPTGEWPEQGYNFRKGLFIATILVLPVITGAGGYVFSRFAESLSMLDYKVDLAEQVRGGSAKKHSEVSYEIRAFRESGKSEEELFQQADTVRAQIEKGLWFAGFFIGFTAGVKLIGLSIQKKRYEYRANPASCLACGRCYNTCPREHLRRGKFEHNKQSSQEKENVSIQ
jgi:ferredoxin